MLSPITTAQHLFDIQNIVLVYHFYCGDTTFTTDRLIEASKQEQEANSSELYDRHNVCIKNYETLPSSRHGPYPSPYRHPTHANIYGYFYSDTGRLTEMVRDGATMTMWV